ncbi:amine oxidase [Mesorhizobium sanjuanii]|uniref:Amine oxidase n=1 Tax=Mesorhizobium sanjuanii TaxID=2037900 RepID=A0A2A6FDW4_9HYPH|nr:MaoC family dehydratase [Mesorhizobium sanjuanii]PDQ19831.1 amine oxidase [Mesorhizobium sanjuanii]
MNDLAPTGGAASTHPANMPRDHTALPVWNTENWFYEDWPVGQKIRSLHRTMAESDSHLFNTLVLDIHPYVQGQMFAESEGIFGKRLIAGAFVFSVGPGLVELGLIRASYEVFKGEGELVLYCEHLQTVKYRNPADFIGKTEK